MPIAMLLGQKLVGTFAAAVKTLTPWIAIVELESTVVARARGAFLVHWFGPRLPLSGLNLRVRLVNLHELEAQFDAARQSVRTSAGGPNLTSPVLGFAGTVAGMLLSPLGAAAGASLLVRFVVGSAKSIAQAVAASVYALAWLAAPVLLVLVPGSGAVLAQIGKGTGILVGGGLLAAGAAFPVAAALGDRREVQSLYDLGGAGARILHATTHLLDQLSGDRKDVRNPLLRGLLRLGDKLAALLAQALGAAEVFVVWIAPLLEPAAKSLVQLSSLVSATFAAVGTVAAGVKAHLLTLVEGKGSLPSILARVRRVAQRSIATAADTMAQSMDMLVRVGVAAWDTMGVTLSAYGKDIRAFVGKLFTDHPVVRVFLALATQVKAISKAWEKPKAAPPAPGVAIQIPPGLPTRLYGMGKSLGAPPPSVKNLLLNALPTLPDVPDFPALPGLPDTDQLGRAAGSGAVPPLTGASIAQAARNWELSSYEGRPVELSAASRAALSRTENRLGVFAAQRRAMDAAGDSPAMVVLLNLQQFERIRDLLTPAVERVLPARMRATVLPKIAEVLTSIDEQQQKFLARKSSARPGPDQGSGDDYPVLDVPSGARLEPVVKTLRLRMPGADPAGVRRFQGLLTERLRRMEFPVTGPPQPAGGN
jgi:hypothetical protein